MPSYHATTGEWPSFDDKESTAKVYIYNYFTITLMQIYALKNLSHVIYAHAHACAHAQRQTK